MWCFWRTLLTYVSEHFSFAKIIHPPDSCGKWRRWLNSMISFREFGCWSNHTHNRKPHVWGCVGERFADVKAVNKVPHCGVGVMVWAGIIDNKHNCILLIAIWVRQTLSTFWDALDRRAQQCIPVPANIQHLHTATEEEWDNIPQATINSLNDYMRRRCIALNEGNGGHTRYWLVFRSKPLSFFKVSVTNRCISVFPVMCNP
jgi:hypothetical protein